LGIFIYYKIIDKICARCCDCGVWVYLRVYTLVKIMDFFCIFPDIFPLFLKMDELFAHFEKKNGKMSGKIQNVPEIFSRFFPVQGVFAVILGDSQWLEWDVRGRKPSSRFMYGFYASLCEVYRQTTHKVYFVTSLFHTLTNTDGDVLHSGKSWKIFGKNLYSPTKFSKWIFLVKMGK